MLLICTFNSIEDQQIDSFLSLLFLLSVHPFNSIEDQLWSGWWVLGIFYRDFQLYWRSTEKKACNCWIDRSYLSTLLKINFFIYTNFLNYYTQLSTLLKINTALQNIIVPPGYNTFQLYWRSTIMHTNFNSDLRSIFQLYWRSTHTGRNNVWWKPHTSLSTLLKINSNDLISEIQLIYQNFQLYWRSTAEVSLWNGLANNLSTLLKINSKS